MNLEKGMYTPERSPTIAAGARGQHSASILLQDEEPNGKDTLNPDYDGPAKYDSPTPEELANTQKLDKNKVNKSIGVSTFLYEYSECSKWIWKSNRNVLLLASRNRTKAVCKVNVI